MDSNSFTHIRNTLFQPSNLIEPVTTILFAGKDISRTVDSSGGNVVTVLSSFEWQQAVISNLVINNSVGTNDINLVATDETDPNAQAQALQEALLLTQVGATVVVRVIRYGLGTATISINGVILMDSTATSGAAIIQATNVTPFQETIDIISSAGVVGSYVDLTSDQTITGTKTFQTNPIIDGFNINNTYTLSIPSIMSNDTIATLSDIPTTSNFMDLTSAQSVTGVKTFLTDPVIAGITTMGGGTLTIPSLLTTDTIDTLGKNQTITGKKTFSTAPEISSITNTGGTLTLPIATGTLALASQIPTNATFVDLTTTDQTISARKLFSVAPRFPGYFEGTGGISLTFPSSSDVLVGRNTSDTLTNKTLTAPIINTIVNGGNTLTLPAANDTLVGQATVDILTNKNLTSGTNTFPSSLVTLTGPQTLTNKTLTSPSITSIVNGLVTITIPNTTGTLALLSDVPSPANFVDLSSTQTITGAKSIYSNSTFVDSTDPTKKIQFSLSTNTTGVTTTLRSNSTTNHTLDLPNASGTLATLADIPSPSSYVDLTSNQTITGIKTFSGTPVISAITNGLATLTLPDQTGTIALSKWGVSTLLTSNTTLSADPGYKTLIPCSSSTPFTVILPTATGNDGLQFRIINRGTGTVTVTASAGQNFDGNSSITTIVLVQNDRCTIMAYDSIWWTF